MNSAVVLLTLLTLLAIYLRVNVARITNVEHERGLLYVGGRSRGLVPPGRHWMGRAPGETASLRNLASAAKLVQDNPALMQLRLLQVLGEQPGNTVVLGSGVGAQPFPIAPRRGTTPGGAPDPEPS